MFLVPLDAPGIEIQAIRTLDGDRTNIVYYSDVRVDDCYRIGDVNGGWSVMRFALDAEHGIVEPQTHGLQNISMMSEHGQLMAEAADGSPRRCRYPTTTGDARSTTGRRSTGWGAAWPASRRPCRRPACTAGWR